MLFDHLALTAPTLEEGTAFVEQALGVSLEGGGVHPLMATHNRLLGLGPDYFEVIAINPDATPPAHPRWFDMDRFEGPPRLTNWIVRVEDMARAQADAVPGVGNPVDLTRGDLAWTMLVPDDGRLPFDNMHPAVISWAGTAHPADRLADKGVRLTRLEVAHPEAAALRAALAGFADPRVAFVTGDPALRASFDTPHGQRSLS